MCTDMLMASVPLSWSSGGEGKMKGRAEASKCPKVLPAPLSWVLVGRRGSDPHTMKLSFAREREGEKSRRARVQASAQRTKQLVVWGGER